jgi:hypothetical protein
MARRVPTARGLRRLRTREEASLHRDIDRLAVLQEGGRSDRPIEVTSPAQVDVRAQSLPCPHCREAPRLLEHRAEIFAGERLRVARLLCNTCGRERRVYFRIAAPLQS